jgi:hypothetical protein
MRPKLTPVLGSRSAQSTVEYMLLISVLVIGLWGVTQMLTRGLSPGLRTMSTEVQEMADDGYVGGGR